MSRSITKAEKIEKQQTPKPAPKPERIKEGQQPPKQQPPKK